MIRAPLSQTPCTETSPLSAVQDFYSNIDKKVIFCYNEQARKRKGSVLCEKDGIQDGKAGAS